MRKEHEVIEEEIDPRFAEGASPERMAERLAHRAASQAIALEPGAYGSDVDLFEGARGLLRALAADRAADEEFFTHKPPVRKANYVYKAEIEIVRLTRDLAMEELEGSLAVMGYRLANSEETMAVCAAHPDLQRNLAIQVLGDVWEDPEGVARRLCLTARHDMRFAWLLAPECVKLKAGLGVPVVRRDGWMLPPRAT